MSNQREKGPFRELGRGGSHQVRFVASVRPLLSRLLLARSPQHAVAAEMPVR